MDDPLPHELFESDPFWLAVCFCGLLFWTFALTAATTVFAALTTFLAVFVTAFKARFMIDVFFELFL